ncbi:NLR family CARD domain-containing protein 3-like [Lates japonicus]
MERIQQDRPDSPEHMRSDQSMENILHFKDELHSTDEREDQRTSDVPQHQTDLDSLFMHLEDSIVTYVKNKLKRFKQVLSSDYPECLQRQSEDETLMDGEDEEQRRSSREGLLKITLNFLRRMKQEELADCLQSSKTIITKV